MLIETIASSGMRIWHAQPDTDEQRPAVLLLHERYGPVEHSFNVLNRFAEYGFVAVMPDLFHRYDGDRGPIERAEDRIDTIDAESICDIDATLAYLRTLPYVDATRIGVAGFCLSGRSPLVWAAARPGDTAAISITHGGIYPRDYHGDKPGQQPLGELIPSVECPVLGMFGEADRSVPMENVSRFRRDLERNGKHYQIRVYAGTPHGWMNTTPQGHYHEESSEDAWATLASFYRSVFAGDWATNARLWRFEPGIEVAYDFAT
jgi:carboxymethylenebutenolidase